MGYVINIHWNRLCNKWSVHYRGKCHLLDELEITTPVKTVYKPNRKTNPRAFLSTKGFLVNNRILKEVSR